MSTSDDIFATALAMSPPLDSMQHDVLLMLCRAAEPNMKLRLRPGIGPEDCYECFVAATAILAISSFQTLQADRIASFDAGSVSVTLKSDQSALAQLAVGMIQPWCDDGFCFRGVRT